MSSPESSTPSIPTPSEARLSFEAARARLAAAGVEFVESPVPEEAGSAEVASSDATALPDRSQSVAEAPVDTYVDREDTVPDKGTTSPEDDVQNREAQRRLAQTVYDHYDDIMAFIGEDEERFDQEKAAGTIPASSSWSYLRAFQVALKDIAGVDIDDKQLLKAGASHLPRSKKASHTRRAKAGSSTQGKHDDTTQNPAEPQPSEPAPHIPPFKVAQDSARHTFGGPNVGEGDDELHTFGGNLTGDMLAEKKTALAAARSEWARVSAKRQRKVVGRRTDEYLAAEAEYKKLSQEVAKLELADQLAAETDLIQKYALIDMHWIEEQNRLRDEATHHIEDNVWWQVVHGFSDFMNSGSRKTRIAKGLTLGLAAGVLGGVAGGGLLAAGFVGASRFARGYTMRHTGGMGQMTDKQLSELAGASASHRETFGDQLTDDELLDAGAARNYAQYDRDSRRQQNKRRTAVAIGGLSVAGGWGAGAVVHHLLGGVSRDVHGLYHSAKTNLEDTYHHLAGDHHAAATGQSSGGNQISLTPDHNSGTGSTSNGYDNLAAHHDNGGSYDGSTGGSSSSQLHELARPHDVYSVHSGEGWYETFKDMGIPEDQWAGVLKDSGPELHKLGYAYYDNAHHEWRMSHTGELSQRAISVIAKASAKHHYAFDLAA